MSVLTSVQLSRKPAAAFAVLGMFWGAFAAQVPVIKAQVGADDQVFGLVLLGTALGLLAPLVLAHRFDRWLGARAMPLSSGLFAASFLLVGVAQEPWALFLVMAVIGATSGLSDVIMNARVSELEMSLHRPLMNANHGMFSVAYACSAVVTGLLREANLEPLSVFILAFIAALVATRFMAQEVAVVPEPEIGEGRFPAGTVVLCGVIVLLAFMGEAAVETWSALHVERTLGGNPAEGALGPAMLGLTMAVGRFGGQAVSERLSNITVVACATLLAIIGALIAAAAPSPVLAYLGFAILGLGLSVIGPIGLAMVGRLVSPSVRTKAISRAAVIGFLGFFIAPLLMGTVSDNFGLRAAFVALAVLVACLFPILALLRRRGA